LEAGTESRSIPIKALHSVAKEYVDELDGRRLDYGAPGTKVTHGAFGPQGLQHLVDAAQPLWQLDRAGNNIRRLMLTNCPQQSAVGDQLSGLAKKLVEFPSTPSAASRSMLWLMISEHGVSLKQLSRISDCIEAVRNRLRSEGKHSVSDLALDPRWRISDPVGIDTTRLVLNFSLGCMAGKIHTSPLRIWLDGTPGEAEVDLAKSPNALDRVRRDEAYYRFYDLLTAQDASVIRVQHKIQEDLERQQETVAAASLMRERVKNHITTLDEQRRTANGKARQWIDEEIQILQTFALGL
jgi:hypothetical protein